MDLEGYFDPNQAYLIVSPKNNRTKAIYRVPKDTTLEYVKRADEEGSIFELRAGNKQDVWWDSEYPDGGKYEHRGVDQIPELPNELLAWWEWEMKKLPKREEPKGELELVRNGLQSAIYVFNLTYGIEDVLVKFGYEKQRKRYISPNFSSGTPGVSIFESHTYPWELCYSHHASDGPLSGRAVDAFEIAAHFNTPDVHLEVAKSILAKECGSRLKARDPDSLDELEITIDQYNAKHPTHFIPEELIYPEGKWGELVHAVENATQFRKNPIAAMINAFAAVAYCAGGAYSTEDLDCTSICFIAVGPTQAGKSTTAQGAKRLIPIDSLHQVRSRLAGSDEAIQDEFRLNKEKPDVWYQIDEIGFLFRDLKRTTGGGNRWQTLLELLAANHYPWSTRGTVKTPSELINCPCLVVTGSTTSEALRGGINRVDVKTGSVNRLVIFDCTQDARIKRKGEHFINENVTGRLEDIFSIGINMRAEQRHTEPKLVEVSPDVKDAMFERDEANMQSANERARHNQYAFRLALVRAIYEDTPVTADLYNWGYKLMKYSYRYIEHLFNTVLADAESYEVIAERKLLKRLKDHGGKMLKRLAFNINEINKMGATRRNQWVNSLIEEGTISITELPQSSGKKKKFVELIEDA